MFIELTLFNLETSIWIKANAIVAVHVSNKKTLVSLSGCDDDIAVVETPDQIMGKVVESLRWNQ